MSPERADVLVVGGGVIGCALAAELAARGRDVIVVERAEPGAEASGAAAGMLSPQAEARTRDAFFDLALASRELYPAWVRVLEEETGVDVGYRRTGLLHCDFAGAAADGRAEQIAWQRGAGLDVAALRAGRAASRDRAPTVVRGRRRRPFPDGGRGRPAPADPGGVAARRAAGRPRADGRRGPRLSHRRRSLPGRRNEGRERSWPTPWWMRRARGPRSTRPCRCRFRSSPCAGRSWSCVWQGPPLPTILSSDDVYVVPRADGTVLLGSTVEHVGFRKEVTAACGGAPDRRRGAPVPRDRFRALRDGLVGPASWNARRAADPGGLPGAWALLCRGPLSKRDPPGAGHGGGARRPPDGRRPARTLLPSRSSASRRRCNPTEEGERGSTRVRRDHDFG